MLLLALGCFPARHDEFVWRFLVSIRDDTAFFRKYTSDEEEIRIIGDRVRPRMWTSDDFPLFFIEHWGSTHDYLVRCGLDASCRVSVHVGKDGQVDSAHVGILDYDPARWSGKARQILVKPTNDR